MRTSFPFLGRSPQNLRPRRSHAFALAGALSWGTFSVPAQADQFILFDAEFEYTWEDANNSSPSKSHFYVNDGNFMNLERPDNWVSPVNYRDGSVHIRMEVIERPSSGQQVGWALCYIANVGAYGCPYTTYETSTGVFENDVAMNAFWTSGAITWESGIKQVDLVYTINNSGSGHVHNFPDLASATTPTKVRITMVQVSQGDTYDPSILDEPDDGTGGAGTGGMDAGVGGDGSVGVGGGVATGGTVGGGGTPGAGGTADGVGTGGNDMGLATGGADGTSDMGDDPASTRSTCSVAPGQAGTSGHSTPWTLLLSGLVGWWGIRRARRAR